MKKCCICGKEIEDWGNNPWGALDENGDQINGKMMMNVVMIAIIPMY